jgi:cysteinyl-tRNA synthetase
VYFRVRRDDEYGKLSGRDLDSLMAGARVEVGERKEDVMDFALWKGQKPGEPAWESPWGPGRPGWHIECSAMAIKYLGETIDLHGGGQDLLFPHHENEIAQSEAYSDSSPFSRFWVHNGTLRMGQDKMSKSLGNVITVTEALDKFSPDALRLFFLSSHYRSPLTYGEQTVAGHERALERLSNALRNGGSADLEESLDPAPSRDRFIAAMDDDLNTPQALAVLFDLAHEINRCKTARVDVIAAQDTLRQLAQVLGFTMEQGRPPVETDVAALVQLLVDTRSELRTAGQYALADSVRDRLAGLGISLEDTADGTEWRAG